MEGSKRRILTSDEYKSVSKRLHKLLDITSQHGARLQNLSDEVDDYVSKRLLEDAEPTFLKKDEYKEVMKTLSFDIRVLARNGMSASRIQEKLADYAGQADYIKLEEAITATFFQHMNYRGLDHSIDESDDKDEHQNEEEYETELKDLELKFQSNFLNATELPETDPEQLPLSPRLSQTFDKATKVGMQEEGADDSILNNLLPSNKKGKGSRLDDINLNGDGTALGFAQASERVKKQLENHTTTMHRLVHNRKCSDLHAGYLMISTMYNLADSNDLLGHTLQYISEQEDRVVGRLGILQSSLQTFLAETNSVERQQMIGSLSRQLHDVFSVVEQMTDIEIRMKRLDESIFGNHKVYDKLNLKTWDRLWDARTEIKRLHDKYGNIDIKINKAGWQLENGSAFRSKLDFCLDETAEMRWRLETRFEQLFRHTRQLYKSCKNAQKDWLQFSRQTKARLHSLEIARHRNQFSLEDLRSYLVREMAILHDNAVSIAHHLEAFQKNHLEIIQQFNKLGPKLGSEAVKALDQLEYLPDDIVRDTIEQEKNKTMNRDRQYNHISNKQKDDNIRSSRCESFQIQMDHLQPLRSDFEVVTSPNPALSSSTSSSTSSISSRYKKRKKRAIRRIIRSSHHTTNKLMLQSPKSIQSVTISRSRIR